MTIFILSNCLQEQGWKIIGTKTLYLEAKLGQYEKITSYSNCLNDQFCWKIWKKYENWLIFLDKDLQLLTLRIISLPNLSTGFPAPQGSVFLRNLDNQTELI
jgi:hypothetical protein